MNDKKFVTINEKQLAFKNDECKGSIKMNNNHIGDNVDLQQMKKEKDYESRKNYISNQYKMASVSYGMLFCLIGVVLT